MRMDVTDRRGAAHGCPHHILQRLPLKLCGDSGEDGAASVAQYLSEDRRSSAACMLERLKNQGARPLPEDTTIAPGIKGTTYRSRIVTITGEIFLHRGVHGPERMNPGTGRPHENDVRVASLQGRVSFRKGRRGTRLAKGDRIVRALQVVIDGNVARRHIGQVLQQPQRIDLRLAKFAPLLKVKFTLLIETH